MAMITHINVANRELEVYCCLRNRVVRLDAEHKHQYCAGCKMFRGEVGGKGVECRWDDSRGYMEPYFVDDPHEEWVSNQKRKIQLHSSGHAETFRMTESQVG